MGETRTERVCIAPTTKDRLERVREDVFSTSDVPYGAAISHLIDEHEGSQ